VWFGDQTLPQIHDDQPRAGRAALAMGFARPALSSYTTCWDTTEEPNSVSKACQIMGYHRDTFYEVRRAF
jgi:hypothetical protein